MTIYYIFMLVFILGLTALQFYLSLKWKAAYKSRAELPKKKRIFIISTAIAVSAVIFTLYFVGLYLIRKFVFIGNDAASIDDQVYFMSLFIPLFLLLIVASFLVGFFLMAAGAVRSKDNDKTVRMLLRIFAVVIGFSLLFSTVGNANYFKYDNEAIYYSSFFQFAETKTNYSEVKRVYIRYGLSGDFGEYSYTYELQLKNGAIFTFGLYQDSLKELNRRLIINGIKFDFEAEHCKAEYNKVFGV